MFTGHVISRAVSGVLEVENNYGVIINNCDHDVIINNRLHLVQQARSVVENDVMIIFCSNNTFWTQAVFMGHSDSS